MNTWGANSLSRGIINRVDNETQREATKQVKWNKCELHEYNCQLRHVLGLGIYHFYSNVFSNCDVRAYVSPLPFLTWIEINVMLM